MRFRKLRIAWSVICGLACVLTLVLWVRSYWYLDMLKARWRGSRSFQLSSTAGEMLIGELPVSENVHLSWDYFSGHMDEYVDADPRMIMSNKRIAAIRAQ